MGGARDEAGVVGVDGAVSVEPAGVVGQFGQGVEGEGDGQVYWPALLGGQGVDGRCCVVAGLISVAAGLGLVDFGVTVGEVGVQAGGVGDQVGEVDGVPGGQQGDQCGEGVGAAGVDAPLIARDRTLRGVAEGVEQIPRR